MQTLVSFRYLPEDPKPPAPRNVSLNPDSSHSTSSYRATTLLFQTGIESKGR